MSRYKIFINIFNRFKYSHKCLELNLSTNIFGKTFAWRQKLKLEQNVEGEEISWVKEKRKPIIF